MPPLLSGIEFRKAVGIAAITFAQVINARHGGVVASVGEDKLSTEQLFNGAVEQVIVAAIQFCPDDVPSDVKEEVKEAIAKRVPPGDRWSPLDNPTLVLESLTDVLEYIYQKRGVTQFYMDARDGYTYIVKTEEKVIEPEPTKTWALYGEN